MVPNEMQSTDADVYADDRLWPAQSGQRPVIIVGLPRSGTSFLSHALSQLPDYYVFDDLYLLSQRDAKQAGDQALSGDPLDKLLYFLGWQIRARHRFGSYAHPAVTEERVEDLNDAIRTSFQKTPGTVLDLQAEWLLRLARAKQAHNWGFKMPRAFLQLERLFSAYPGVQMIYLMRQPEDVLSSYKNMPDDPDGDGDPRRYHPLVYALYWRLAARNYLRATERHAERVHLVRFHEFIADPLATANEIAGILKTDPVDQVTQPEKPNSSFRDKTDTTFRKQTGLEARLIRAICGKYIKALGFEERPLPSLAGSDVLDFMRSTWICGKFHFGRLIGRLRSQKT